MIQCFRRLEFLNASRGMSLEYFKYLMRCFQLINDRDYDLMRDSMAYTSFLDTRKQAKRNVLEYCSC